MPVPGSLKKRPIDENEIAELLSRQFALPKEETLAYLKLLETDDLTTDQLSSTLGSAYERVNALVGSMITKGLIIQGTGSPKRYSPLHPRMTLTNIFKIYEKEMVQMLRDRRATVDRVVNMLIPIYEERETRKAGKTSG
jgi:sugar-specific transcriptional regulator TrmB